MTQDPLQARPRHIGLGILALLSLFLAAAAYSGRLPSLTVASAQEATPAAPAPDPAAAPPDATAPTPDPITNSQVELLREDGLIGRQLVINEGLLLMDRQLRQAQVAEQLLAVLGPDALIEVVPGEFRSYSDTPAGIRQQIQFLQLQQELRQAKLDLGEAPDATGVQSLVTEVYGRTGRYTAVVSVGGRKAAVNVGDTLADGTEVLAISEFEVRLKRPDLTVERLRTPD
jgi:hypothetical protein